MRKLLSQLPSQNKHLLKHFISLLSTITNNVEVTKMNVINLATCFNPNLRPRTEEIVLEAQKSQIEGLSNLFEILIEHHDVLFFEAPVKETRNFGDIEQAHQTQADEETSLQRLASSGDPPPPLSFFLCAYIYLFIVFSCSLYIYIYV